MNFEDMMKEFDVISNEKQIQTSTLFHKGHIIDDVMQEFDEQQNVLHEDNLQMVEGFVIDKVMPEIDNQPIYCDEDNLEVHGGIDFANAITDIENVDVMGSLEGVKCQNLQNIEELYYKHARAIGFGVRKSTVRYRKDKISEKYCMCL
ncbi:unnamed protein product [Amaranthus hypochondriacus]